MGSEGSVFLPRVERSKPCRQKCQRRGSEATAEQSEIIFDQKLNVTPYRPLSIRHSFIRATEEAEKSAREYGCPDLVEEITRRKYRWAGHVARRADGRWTKEVLDQSCCKQASHSMERQLESVFLWYSCRSSRFWQLDTESPEQRRMAT